jgi:CHAT domain-containing protein
VKEADLNLFKGWITTYQAIKKIDKNEEQLLELGKNLFNWLNGADWLSRVLDNVDAPFFIEFQIPKRASEAQHAFTEAPWELLADDKGHLAKDPFIKFCPLRRIGWNITEPPVPSKYWLNTVFMAASPRDVEPMLAYEKEESVILNLHQDTSIKMDLTVEESGNLEQLVRLISDVKNVDAVHISCHGNIEEGTDKNAYLCLEGSTGDVEKVQVGYFSQTYSIKKPRLLFVSACKTSEAFQSNNHHQKTVYQSLVQSLCRYGFSTVLGWSGSVSDQEATRFAGDFYRNLSLGGTVQESLVHARAILLNPPKGHDETKGYISKAWHLARLYLGPNGGGVLATGEENRILQEHDAGVKEFLDIKGERVPVANRSEFVGRRREIQHILADFKKKDHAGILVMGLGNQGKSSLASRVANRLRDYRTVVIYGDQDNKRMYSEYHVLNAIKTVADPDTEAQIAEFQQRVEGDKSFFKSALKSLLEGPFAVKNGSHQPILLVMDDLEKLLVPPGDHSGLYTVENDFQNVLGSVVKAFKEAQTNSRLLMTCRYDFDLVDSDGIDVGKYLYKVPLPSMNDIEAKKQYIAKSGQTQSSEKEKVQLDPDRVVKTCQGNPGLQDLVFSLYTQSPEQYEKALIGVENYLKDGEHPEEIEVQEFLKNIAIDQILDLLTDGEKQLLELATWFDIPVPGDVFAYLAGELGIETNRIEKRLLGFGLLERCEGLVDSKRTALMLNKLVRPCLEKPAEEVVEVLAGGITDILVKCWYLGEEDFHLLDYDQEIIRFALIGNKVKVIKRFAKWYIRGLHFYSQPKKAAEETVKIVRYLKDEKHNIPLDLYKAGSFVCLSVGWTNVASGYIDAALEQKVDDKHTLASLYLIKGNILKATSNIEQIMMQYLFSSLCIY